MSLAVPKSEKLHASAQNVTDKLENVFSDARVQNMFAAFEAKAKDGFVGKGEFPAVLSALFEDPTHEQVSLLLDTPFFMDRVFAFLDQGNKGKLSHEDLERVGLMFSADSQELIAFRFFVYDASAKGFITKEDMTKMVRAIFETTLKVRERDLEALAKQDKAEEGALEKFRKARDQFLGKSDVVDSKISQIVNFAFETTVRKEDGKITKDEFITANLKNDDLFDWRGLGEDLADHVDDLSRLI